MSSGTKRCALGVHCFIFKFHIYDRSRVDWTEIQDSDEKSKVTTLMGKVNRAVGETLHLAEDVRMELDYLAALDDGRYRCVVMLVHALHELGLELRFSHSLPFIRVWSLPAAARAFLLGLADYGHSAERCPPVQAFWKRKQLPAEYSLESVVSPG